MFNFDDWYTNPPIYNKSDHESGDNLDSEVASKPAPRFVPKLVPENGRNCCLYIELDRFYYQFVLEPVAEFGN